MTVNCLAQFQSQGLVKKIKEEYTIHTPEQASILHHRLQNSKNKNRYSTLQEAGGRNER